MKEKRIVYGLGENWQLFRLMICNVYDVTGICDQNTKDDPNFITRENLNCYSEKILITSDKYYEKIKRTLIDVYQVDEARIDDREVMEGMIAGFDKKTRYLDTWIKNKLAQIPKGSKILDAGAGELKWKGACSHLEYTAQDICQYDGAGAEGMHPGKWDTSGIQLVCDIIQMPVSDRTFDAVLCSEVFEHIPNAELAVKELSRVLKSGGILILTTPFSSMTHFAPYHYATGFNRYWFEEILPKYDLQIEEILPNGDYYLCMQMELVKLPQVIRQYNHGYAADRIFEHAQGLIEEMEHLHRKDNKSSEFWNFGYMVFAKKL